MASPSTVGITPTLCSQLSRRTWNKIEHHLFSRITQNWRSRPLTKVIVNLIANTTTTTGLKVRCQLDPSTYPTGVKVSDAELARVHIERQDFHGDWNYVIRPSQKDGRQELVL